MFQVDNHNYDSSHTYLLNWIDWLLNGFTFFVVITDSRRTWAPCCGRHWERSSAGFIKLPFTDYWKNKYNRVIRKHLNILVWFICFIGSIFLFSIFANLQVLKTDGSLVAVLGVRQKWIPWRFRYKGSNLESLMGILMWHSQICFVDSTFCETHKFCWVYHKAL